jgi:hypothetical protein
MGVEGPTATQEHAKRHRLGFHYAEPGARARPQEAEPTDRARQWLLLAICILLGLIASQVVKRFL